MKTLEKTRTVIIELTIEEANRIRNALLLSSNKHDELVKKTVKPYIKKMWEEESSEEMQLWCKFYKLTKYGKN